MIIEGIQTNPALRNAEVKPATVSQDPLDKHVVSAPLNQDPQNKQAAPAPVAQDPSPMADLPEAVREKPQSVMTTNEQQSMNTDPVRFSIYFPFSYGMSL